MAAKQPVAGRRAAVLGCPIAHSLSPALHRAAYAELGLDWSYDAVEVTELGLAAFLDGLDHTWAGLSLTMPLKRAVVPLLDEVLGMAATVEAANTVVFRADRRRVGENTDIAGMVAAVLATSREPPSRAVVLGGGATAASALAALAQLGATSIEMYVRKAARAAQAREIAGRLDVHVAVHRWNRGGNALDADLVIATTPAGATDFLVGRIPSHPAVLLDVVYDPWPTMLAAGWARAGGTVIGGLDLLVEQAALQVNLMTGGLGTPLAAMRAAGEAALAARASPLGPP